MKKHVPMPAKNGGVVVSRGYRTEVAFTPEQETLACKGCGTNRFAYNWGLTKIEEYYRLGRKRPSAIDLSNTLNEVKAEKFPWMYEVSKAIPQEAFRGLEKAYLNFFRNPEHFQHPKVKRKKDGMGSFRLLGSITVERDRIRLPRLGWVRLKERGYLPTRNVKILSATVSAHAGRWYVSLQAEQEISKASSEGRPKRGLDVGIHSLMDIVTLIDDSLPLTPHNVMEEVVANPKALENKATLRKLRRLNRSLFRKIKGSRNWINARRRLATFQNKIADVRKDAIHKATTRLAKTSSAIGAEKLDVYGMLAKAPKGLSRRLADASLGEIRRQLAYKTPWYGSCLETREQWDPLKGSSTQRCSWCGHFKTGAGKLRLSDRTYRCDHCKLAIVRDFNSAINNLAIVAVSCTETENALPSPEVHALEQVLGDEVGTISLQGGPEA